MKCSMSLTISSRQQIKVPNWSRVGGPLFESAYDRHSLCRQFALDHARTTAICSAPMETQGGLHQTLLGTQPWAQVCVPVSPYQHWLEWSQLQWLAARRSCRLPGNAPRTVATDCSCHSSSQLAWLLPPWCGLPADSCRRSAGRVLPAPATLDWPARACLQQTCLLLVWAPGTAAVSARWMRLGR